MSTLSSCAHIVQTHHRSAYIASLLASESVREHMLALYAFHYEIEHIRTTVSEEMVGMIRLQWWRDTIADLFEGKSRNHDVVKGLEKAIQAGNWKQNIFEQLFRAHEEDYSPAPFKDLNALIHYADHTHGTLWTLLLALYDAKDENIQQIAQHLGRAELICKYLRLLPYHLKEEWCTLPESLLAEQNTSSEALLAGKAPLETIEPAIQALTRYAQQEYDAAHQLKSALTREERNIFRVAALLPSQLKQLKQHGAAILHSPITLSPIKTPLTLWWGW